ncbi:MAG TPA: protein kinase, partial [Kofleriaceae bacterium]
MTACLAEDDLLDLAQGRRRLGDAPVLEAHLADCPACSGLLSTLIASTPEDRRDLVGTTLGPYRLDGLVGAGAMGEVYRAWDTRLQREVAVKVLSRRLADSPERIRRLEAEARAAAAIAHPNVVTVYDTGTDQGVPYIVSELIQGETLRSVIDRGPIARATALDLALQLARGLAAAHTHGVVHRDLKPANLIVRDGTLKILDFGLAKLTGDRDVDATEPGTLVGTSGYLAPEQARGEPTDARSDIFAVGAIGYELLTGRRAFAGSTFAERLSAVLRDTPQPIDDPAWPILLRCLAKNPANRFQSAIDLAWALDKLDAAPVQRAPRTRAAVSRRTFVIGAAATGIGGMLVGRALVPRASTFRPAFAQLTFRQGRVGRARFTPDGGSILYSAAWDGGPMTMFTIRLAGGGTRVLEMPPAQLLAVSSRGQLALSLDHRFYESFHQEGQLALAPLEGGEPRALGTAVQDADFTPDGAMLAIVRRAGNRFRLECPLDRVLLEAGWISHPRVSPDGSRIACLVHAGPHDNAGDLVIVPLTGGAERTLSGGWSSIDGIAWAGNSRALWVSASREGGNSSVRAIGLDGKELVHHASAGRLRVHDRSASGTLAVTHVSGRLHMMVKAPGSATETELGLSDVTLAGAMTADGNSLAFC